MVMQSTDWGEGGWSGGKGRPEGSKEICLALEMSFRKVWLRIFLNGADAQYVAAFREFVQAAVAAYDAGYSLPALILELSRNEVETGDVSVDKTIRLTDQERQTREIWLVLVYLSLDRLGYMGRGGDNAPPAPQDDLGLQQLVESTCDALEAGFSLEGLKLELSLRQSGEVPVALNPAQLSLRSQWTRIVFLTADVIKGSVKGA